MSNKDEQQENQENVLDEEAVELKMQPKKKPSRGFKFYLKVLVAFTLLISLSCVIAVYYVYNRLSNDSGLEKIIMAKVSEALKMPVSFQKLSISFPDFTIKEVQISTDTPNLSAYITVGNIGLRPDFMAAISGKFIISSLSVSSSTVKLIMKKSKGRIVGNKETVASSPMRLSEISFPFKSISFEDISVMFSDLNSGIDYNFNLQNASLSEAFLGGSYPFSIEATIDKLTDIKASGNLNWPESIETNINLKNIKMKKIENSIPVQYQSLLQKLSGSSISASVKYAFANKLEISKIKLQAGSMAVLTGNVDVDSFSPISADGVIDFDAELPKVWDSVHDLLPKNNFSIVPMGKAKFSGNFSYRNNFPQLSGSFKILGLSIKEAKNSVALNVPNCDLVLDKLSKSSGKLVFKKFKLNGLGADISINGEIVNKKSIAINLSSIGNINVKEFAAIGNSIFKLDFKPDQFAGNIAINANIRGSIADLKPQGNFDFTNIKISIPEKGMNIVGLSAKAKAEKDSLTISSINADIMDGKLSMNGKLTNFKKPTIEAKADIAGVSLGQIRSFLKTNFPAMPDEIKFKGKANLSMGLNGSISAPKISGSALIINADFFHPAMLRPVDKVNGQLSLNNNGIKTESLKMNWGKSVGTVKGTLQNWTKFITNFRYVVNPIDLDDIGDFFLKSTGHILIGKGTGKGTVTGPVSKIVVTGIANVPTGNFKTFIADKKGSYQFPFNNLVAPFKFSDNVFTVTKANATLFKGAVNASAKFYLDKNPLSFNYNLLAREVKSEEFLAINMNGSKLLTGGVSGKFNASGDTGGLATLNGNLSFGMTKGTYAAPSSAQGIFRTIGLGHLASGTINHMGADGKISAGRIHTKNLALKNKNGRVEYDGSIGLDTTLKGTANMILPKEVCLKTDVLKQLIGKQNELDIPIKIRGTLTSPKIDAPLDKMISRAAKKSVGDSLKKTAADAIGKLLGKKKTEGKKDKKLIDTKKIQNKMKDLGKNLGKSLKKLFKF